MGFLFGASSQGTTAASTPGVAPSTTAGAGAAGSASNVAAQTATPAAGAGAAATGGGKFLESLIQSPTAKAFGEGSVSAQDLGLGGLFENVLGKNLGGFASQHKVPINPLPPLRRQDSPSPLEDLFRFLRS